MQLTENDRVRAKVARVARKLFNLGLVPLTFENWPLVLFRLVRIYLRRPLESTTVVKVRGGLKFHVRNVNAYDYGSLLETFARNVYIASNFASRYPIPLTIIDVGASIGDFACLVGQIATREGWRGTTRVLCFGPSEDAIALLRRNVTLNGFDDFISVFPVAVTGGKQLAITNKTYDFVTLDDILEKMGEERCALLKMDVEGAEYDILGRASSDTLQKIDAIAMECHRQAASYMSSEALELLVRRLGKEGGFDQVKVTPWNVHNVCYLYANRLPLLTKTT